MKEYKPVYEGLYSFDTFTFTSLGTVGHRGPDPDKGYANAPWRDGDFYIQDGVQHWTVPTTGIYSITAAGAYGAQPGRVVSGTVPLYEGQTLEILVGQQPTPLTANVADNVTVGGGGGTFVTTNKLLMVASGGDGTGGHAGSFSPYGSGNGKNGGGYLSNGLATNDSFKFLKPEAYVNGGYGNRFLSGVVREEGGFGGGQAPVTTGVSGGGGYTGSPGDGVSGATCYADSTVENFTDLEASSNTSGYVTVSLVDPTPIKPTWSWDPTKQWTPTNGVASGLKTCGWSSSLRRFIAITDVAQVVTSPDGKTWSTVPNNLPIPSNYNFYYQLAISTSGVLLAVSSENRSVYRSTDAVTWTLITLSSLILDAFFVNNLFILRGWGKCYTSPDGITWTSFIPDLLSPAIAYGNSKYIMAIGTRNLYTSTDLTTWSSIPDSNVTTSINGWTSVLFDNQTFVAIRVPIPTESTDYRVITSTDGINWTGRTAPSGTWTTLISGGGSLMALSRYFGSAMYSLDNGTTWKLSAGVQKAAMAGVYSPTLNYFLFINESSFSLSLDGSIIVPSVSGGTVGNPDKLVWADTLGIAVAVTTGPCSIITSSDLITWTNVLVPNEETFSRGIVSWSRELGLLVAYFLRGDSRYVDTVYTSNDGITWYKTNAGGRTFPNCKPCWSSQLGLFTIGRAFSRDGTNWIFGSGPNLNCVAWSPTLKAFVGSYFGSYYYSTDGINWTTTNSYISSDQPTISWSPELRLFVSAQSSYGDVGRGPCVIYTSSDGINWIQVYSDVTRSRRSWRPFVVWSPELGIFVCVYQAETTNTGIRVLISSNGTTWTSPGNNIINTLYSADLIWSPELKTFIYANWFQTSMLTSTATTTF